MKIDKEILNEIRLWIRFNEKTIYKIALIIIITIFVVKNDLTRQPVVNNINISCGEPNTFELDPTQKSFDWEVKSNE